MIFCESRVSAFRLQTYNEAKNTLVVKYIPEIEYFDKETDEEGQFVCITDNNKKPMEFDSELEALQYAINYRRKFGE